MSDNGHGMASLIREDNFPENMSNCFSLSSHEAWVPQWFLLQTGRDSY